MGVSGNWKEGVSYLGIYDSTDKRRPIQNTDAPREGPPYSTALSRYVVEGLFETTGREKASAI